MESLAISEVVEDGLPILIVTASDISGILRNNAINTTNLDIWLDSIDKSKSKSEAYYSKLY